MRAREKHLQVGDVGADPEPFLFEGSNSLVRNIIPGLNIFDFERVRIAKSGLITRYL